MRGEAWVCWWGRGSRICSVDRDLRMNRCNNAIDEWGSRPTPQIPQPHPAPVPCAARPHPAPRHVFLVTALSSPAAPTTAATAGSRVARCLRLRLTGAPSLTLALALALTLTLTLLLLSSRHQRHQHSRHDDVPLRERGDGWSG